MEKNQRNKAKKKLKKNMEHLIGLPMGCSASFKDETNTWKVHMSVDFPIPADMELVEKGSLEDAKRPQVVAFMESKRKEIEEVLKATYNAVPVHTSEEDFNYTQTFPPMIPTISMVSDANGVRLKTPEELEEAKQQHPSLADMIAYDQEVLSKGYFVFEGTEEYQHYDGFRLVKYGSLRARYIFIIPHEEKKEAS